MKNKFKAIRTTVDGITFASKKEANYYVILKLRKKKGEIKDFEMQVPYKFACGVKYILDFRVTENDGSIRYIDVKGVLTPVYKLKKKLMKHEFGIELKEV